MRKIITGLFTIVIIAGMGAFAWKACAADDQTGKPEDQRRRGGCRRRRVLQGGRHTPPMDLVSTTPKGGLHNPYADKVTEPSPRRDIRPISRRAAMAAMAAAAVAACARR